MILKLTFEIEDPRHPNHVTLPPPPGADLTHVRPSKKVEILEAVPGLYEDGDVKIDEADIDKMIGRLCLEAKRWLL